MPSFSPSKDVSEHPLLKTATARFAWRIFTQKLTVAGRWLAVPTLMFASYSGLSLNIQGYIPFSYLFSFWVLAAASMFMFRPRVKLRVMHAPQITAGQTLPVDVEIEQRGRLSQSDLVVLPHRLPYDIDADPDGGASLQALRRGQKTLVRLGLRCPRRGVFKLRGYRVESDFPFGLLRASRVFAEERQLLVYPQFNAIGRMDLPTARKHHPGGVAMASNLGESAEYIGNREYRQGDSIRDIDWRATARLNRTIVREFREEYFLRAAVILDTHVVAGAKPEARDNFERTVSVAAAVADYMSRHEYLVDLFAAGPNLYHLTAGRSLAYLDQILEILACVEPNPQEPFGVIEPQLMQNLAQITTVICVFLDWTASRRELVLKLLEGGTVAKVIVVRDADCTLAPGADADRLGGITVVSRARYEAGLEAL